jgi:N-methylhydantoinase A/oxoprolinase/acetone carboxylase beta subunit
VAGEYDGRFVRAVPGMNTRSLSGREAVLMERLGGAVLPLGALLRNRIEQGALGRLVDRGLVQIAGVTPSDASHVLGTLDDWDRAAAEKALRIMARRRVGSGERLAEGPEALARMIVDQLTHQTVLTLLETAFAEERDAGTFAGAPDQLARHELMREALAGHTGLLALQARLTVDVVGLGASAPNYYPAVGERLGCRMILPGHAGVANAIGAVVGRVTVRRSGTITSPAEGRYRVHLETGPEDFGDPDMALSRLEGVLRHDVERAALAAGAEGVQYRVARDVKTARTEARDVFVEALLTVEASGRARVARA